LSMASRTLMLLAKVCAVSNRLSILSKFFIVPLYY
jgi:hypothetical protein